MRTSAIICEFNPFHRGHERLVRFAREKGADRIVCIMSGNFVQRGEPAIADKYTRAKAAVLSGADLVLELPMPFSAASAEYFARAGASIADRLGFADELVFGSELGESEELTKIAENQLSADFCERLEEIHSGEIGYAVAVQRAYEELYGKNDALTTPNNILAIEYIKALRGRSSNMTVRTVAREDNYSSAELSGEYPSATALRRLIYSGEMERTADGIPVGAYKAFAEALAKGTFPIDMSKYGFILLSAMRLALPEMLSECEGVCGGLENRIIQSALASASYDEFLSMLSTKKYTDARLRRALLAAFIGVKHSDMLIDPCYVKLLAASGEGRELLATLRKNKNIAAVTKVSDIKDIISGLEGEKKAQTVRLYEINKRCDALYSLCLPKTKNAFFFDKMSPFVEK